MCCTGREAKTNPFCQHDPKDDDHDIYIYIVIRITFIATHIEIQFRVVQATFILIKIWSEHSLCLLNS